MFGKKEDYIGSEWIGLLDRLTVGKYHQPKDFTINAAGRVTILEEYCNACGHCVLTCPVKALELVDRKEPIKSGKQTITKVTRAVEISICGACGVCEAICPRDAISLSKPIQFEGSQYKTINKGPLSLPRLFSEKKGDKGWTTGR